MSRPLEILFPVDFSELDSRAIPWVAQLVDALEALLTLLHVHSAKEPEALATERLRSFFAEADRYPHCERVVSEGEVVEAVTRRCAQSQVDLLILPASEPVWLPRLGHNSSRLSLLERTRVPLWTIAPGLNPARLHLPVRNVACWIDLFDGKHGHVPSAARFASAMGAQLHLLCALPEVTVPIALDESVPLHRDTATRHLIATVQDEAVSPKVWVAEEDNSRERRALLEQCNADVVFVAEPERPLLEWLGARPPWFHETSAPVVFVPSAPLREPWVLQPRRRLPRAAPELRRRAS